MPKTPQEIDATATAMKAAGAPDADVQRYVSLALSEVPAPAQTAPVAAPAEYSDAGAKQEWASASPVQRAALLMAKFGGYGKAPLEAMAKSAVSGGARVAGPVLGQALGAATGPAAPIAVPVLGAIGGAVGELGAQMNEGGALRSGAIGGAAIAGAMPGSSLAGAGAKRVGAEMVKQGVGNIAAKTAETAIDEARLPTALEAGAAATGAVIGTGLAKSMDKGLNAQTVAAALKRSQDSTRRETIKLGQELGYVLPPSVLRPNLANDTINSIGGKAAMAQEAVRRNQPITNAAVREELGLPPGEGFSPKSLNNAKIGPNATYAKVAGVSPEMKIMLDTFKQEQADASQLFTTYRDQFPKKPEILAGAKAAQQRADEMADIMEGEAVKAGKKDLMKEFHEARVKFAKIGLAERALNKGDGNIDASVIGRALDAGEKLTGNFEKIGRFQQAFGQAVREASKVPPSGVNQLMPILAGGMGTYGAMTTGAAGAAAALPFFMAPRLARDVALSQFFQRNAMNPTYGVTRQDIPAMLARFGSSSLGRQQLPQSTP